MKVVLILDNDDCSAIIPIADILEVTRCKEDIRLDKLISKLLSLKSEREIKQQIIPKDDILKMLEDKSEIRLDKLLAELLEIRYKHKIKQQDDDAGEAAAESSTF